MDVENETPLFYERFASHKDAQEVCVWCRVLGTNQSILCYVQETTVKDYTLILCSL